MKIDNIIAIKLLLSLNFKGKIVIIVVIIVIIIIVCSSIKLIENIITNMIKGRTI